MAPKGVISIPVFGHAALKNAKDLNISVGDEEKTVQHFRFELDREIDRLEELCAKWVDIKSDPNLSEESQFIINQAVQQTNSRMYKMFGRFRKLVFDCDIGNGHMLVTCKDLHGFWDMTRFRKLEELMARGWEEEQSEVVKKVTEKKVPMKKKEIPKNEMKHLELPSVEFDGGFFFVVKSPRKSVPQECKIPTPRSTKKRASLLQQVQLAEASKNMESPLVITRVNQLCKTPQVELDDTITYVNSGHTPGRRILKRVEESSITAPNSTKAQLKVNFNDDVMFTEVLVDEEVQNKRDLAAKLARIDSYDMEGYCEDEIDVRTEKKLNFSDDSFEEIEKGVQHGIARQADSFELDNSFGPKIEDEAPPEDIDWIIPDIVEIGTEAAVPEVEKSPITCQKTPLLSSIHVQISKSRKSRENEPVEDTEEEEDTEQKENKVPRKVSRKSSKKVNDKDSSQDVETVKTPGSRSKSSRKPLLEEGSGQVPDEPKTLPVEQPGRVRKSQRLANK